MAIEVEVPDVGIVEFPDDTHPDQIKSVLAKRYSKQAAVPVPMIQPGQSVPGLEPYTNGRIPLKPTSESTSQDILAFPPAIRESALSSGLGQSIPAQPVREARALEKVAPFLNQTDNLSKQRIGKVLESSLQEPLPVPSIGQDIVKAGTQGAFNDAVTTLGLDSQTVADAVDVLSGRINEKRRTPSAVEKVFAGGQSAVTDALNFFTSPLGVATLGTGSLPAGAQRAIAGAFTADMASHAPEQVNALIAAVKSGDWEAGSKAAVGLGLTGVFIKQGAEHALGKTKPATERTQDVIQQKAQETPGVLETAKPALEDLIARKPGEVTAQEIASLSPEAEQRLFDEKGAAGNANQNDGVLAGMKLTKADVPELTRLRDEAQKQWVEDFKSGKVKALSGKVTWLNGAIEGANRAGPNFKAVSERPATETPPPRESSVEKLPKAEQEKLNQGDGRKYATESGLTEADIPRLEELKKKHDAAFKASGYTDNAAQALAEFYYGARSVIINNRETKPSATKPSEAGKVQEFQNRDLDLSAEIDRRGGIEKVSKSDAPADVLLMEKFQENQSNWEIAVSKEKAKFASSMSDEQVLSKAKAVLMGAPRDFNPESDAYLAEINKRGLEGKLKASFESGIYDKLKQQYTSELEQGAAQPERLPEKPVAPVAGEEAGMAEKKGKSKRDIIRSEWNEGNPEQGGDGYWIQLKEGWEVDGSTAIHEATKKKAYARLGDAKPAPPETQGTIATSTPLTPSATTTTLTPKSQRQIITDLAKGLDLPIRFGRLTTSKFAGYFKPRANLIGSKKAVDVPTVSHEVGHKLDDTLKLSADKSIAAELDVLGDPATPGSGSSWTPSKTKKYKMGEGVAEFVRHWLTDPAKALKDAPNTHKAFEAALDANKDFGDVMRQAQDDIRTWRESEPQARLRSHISTDNPNKTRYTLSQLTRDVVDDLHILRLAVIDANKSGTLPPSKDPYLAARNLRGSYGMAETFIRNGVADFNTKEVKLGTSLQDALKPVAGRLSDFRDWIVSKRAQELRKQGKETGLVASDVDAVVSKFDKDQVFQKAFDDVKAWNDAALQYAVDSGLITPESAAAMRKMNLDYVPFSRLFEVGAGEAPSQQGMGIGAGLNVGKPGSFKRLSGSTREIVDPIETMIKNAYTIITASEKAAINRSVAEMANLPDMGKWVEKVAAPKEGIRFDLERVKKQLEDAGADLTNVPDDLILSFFRQSGRAPFGENIIRVIRDGEPEFYRLNRDLHDTFQALDLEDSGKLVRILSAPAQLLRAGVVLEPSFNVANALRDTFSAAVINKYGALPFETTLKGVAAMIKNPQAVAEWAASGGKNSVEANFFDRTKMQKFLTEKISKDLTPAERALIVTKSPLTALRWLTSKAEEATRIGEYQIAYKKLTESGMPEAEARRLAAFEARDRQDFAKGGAKTKIIRHMSAFWNASLQANVKLAQAFKERPGRTILQGLAFVTLPKLLEQAVNWDDEDYWKRQQWERDMFFMIPIGKDQNNHTRFLRIPTPFEVGIIFGTFPGRLLQWMRTNKPESVAGFPQLMLKQSVPNPIPQTMQVAFEDFLSGEKGWDIWRGRTIVPESLADLPADLQWTDQTSGLAKEVGKRMGFSPMKVDHIIERTTGGMGKLLTGRQVPGQRFVAAPLAVSNQPINDFYETLDKLREEHARVKATKRGLEPKGLQQFEATARELSELRDKAGKSKSEAQKAMIQEQIFQKAKKQMDRYRP